MTNTGSQSQVKLSHRFLSDDKGVAPLRMMQLAKWSAKLPQITLRLRLLQIKQVDREIVQAANPSAPC